MNATTQKLLQAIQIVEAQNVNAIKQVIELVGVESARALYAYRIVTQTDPKHAAHVLEVSFGNEFYP